jgi:hypothetical protein
MWTKFLNLFGVEAKAQQLEQLRRNQEILREARVNQALLRANHRANKDTWGRPTGVIKTTDVPTRKSNKGTVHRPSQQVRAEKYGYSDQDTYVPTVFIPAITIPVPETTHATSSHSTSYSDSSSSSGYSSDSGSGGGSFDSGGSW